VSRPLAWHCPAPVGWARDGPLIGSQILYRYFIDLSIISCFIDHNRYDPFSPWQGGHQLAIDWCDKGADVQFFTNELPPFLNKTVTNHFLTLFVDGERGMQWIADRFNGLPTSPNCAEIRNE
jgi:Secretory lipase